PFAAGDQLERAGADFRPGLGHADDDGLAPALVTALQRLAHDLGVADALEGIVRAAVGQLDDVVNDVFDLVGIDEVGHAELARQRLARRVNVHPDDLVGADHARALDDVQADTAQPEHRDVGTG